MADRAKRTGSTARPAEVVIKAKQKRRTPAEIARDNLVQQQRKAEKQSAAAEKKRSGVKRVAAAEEQIRKQDERTRSTAARPDLVTAQLKRAVMAETQPEEHEVTSPTIPEHRGMAESQPEEPEVTSPTVPPSIPSPSTATPDEDMPVDDEDPVYDGDNDGDYVDDHGDDGAADSSTSGDDVDAEDEHIQAQISAFSKQLFAKKREAQKTKPKKGDLRSEIQDAYEVPPVAKVAKRKPADGDGAVIDLG
ncbi:hypothetical protein B0H10DRAFT_2436951 [Mycena sp. CBHHK59/15]|nr:hypothetical protein B0H10DRAFT_2436951 [Mycena sp. CBHHK59/15]